MVQTSKPSTPSQAEILLRVTSGIASELIKAHESNTPISLNVLRASQSKKYAFKGVPRLVDIISAIPDEWKKVLLPRLKARPVRTASGVSIDLGLLRLISENLAWLSPDRGCSCDV